MTEDQPDTYGQSAQVVVPASKPATLYTVVEAQSSLGIIYLLIPRVGDVTIDVGETIETTMITVAVYDDWQMALADTAKRNEVLAASIAKANGPAEATGCGL